MRWVCVVIMWSLQTRTEKSFSYSISYSYSNLKVPNKPMTVFDSGPCDWLGLPLLLPTPTTQFSLDHKRQSRKRNQKKWKRSDSSDSDSVELTTPLTTPILDFH